MTAGPPVGFIGLGAMGVPMVNRLLEAGFPVIGTTRSRERAASVLEAGMEWADDVAQVATSASVVMTALPTEQAVRAVVIEALDHAGEGQVIVDHSTVSVNLAKELSSLADGRSVGFLDAPVSGGPAGARAGTLTVMVGGQPGHLEQVSPQIRAYGDPIHFCGPPGSGQVVKLVNQLLVGIHTVAAAEASELALRLGADPSQILEVVGTSFGASTMLARNLPRIAEEDFEAATSVKLLSKDLGIILREAETRQLALRIGNLVQELFSEAESAGYGDDDMAGIVRLWRDGT